MSGYPRIARQRELGKIVDAQTILAASPIVATAIDCTGFNQLTLELFLDYTAATHVTITAETADDLSGTPVWHKLQGAALAAGVITLTDLSWVKASGGADCKWTVNLPLNYKALRLTFTSTLGTTDTLTVRGRLGYLP